MSDHERDSRSSIDPDADWDDRWNGRGHATGRGGGGGSRSADVALCEGSPETEPPRRRDLLALWKSDLSPKRLRGDSAPSVGLGGLDESGRLRGLAGVDGLAVDGLRARGEPSGLKAGELGSGV